MNERFIQEALCSRFSNHKYHLLNSYIFRHNWESDFFSISNSGYQYEVEIKISKGDFKADLKKEKHKIFSSISSGYYIERGGKYREFYKANKDGNEYIEACNVNIAPIEKIIMPHKFYYACPSGLIQRDDIPEYAGLIYITRWGENGGLKEVTTIKEAPFLHKRNQDVDSILKDKFYWKAKNLEFKNYNLAKEIEKLKTELKNKEITV